MADTGIPLLDEPIDWAAIALQIASALTQNENISFDGVRAAVVAGVTQALGAKLSAIFTYSTWIAGKMGEGLHDMEEPFIPVLAGFIAPVLAGMFGSSIDASAFATRANNDKRGGAAGAIVDAFMAEIVGDADGPIEPGDDGSKRIATAAVHAAIEGWFNAAVPELLSDLIPLEMGHFTAFTELPHEVIGALGVGRLVRQALRPLVHATATVPMTWATNAKYRPTKLPAATAIKEYLRGRFDEDTMRASLAMDGYRDEHMDALINEQRKFLSAEDLAWLVWQNTIGVDEATTTLQNYGFDAQTASKHISVQTLKRIDTINRELATAAITAYAERRIEDGDLGQVISATIASDRERALLTSVAQGKRALHTKPLTPAEAKQCVEAGVLAVADYRNALDRAGYASEAADALELLLRVQLDAKKSVADHKQQQADAKATATANRTAAAAEAKKRVDAARALKLRGPIGVLENAVIRGLIPISRLGEVLSAEYDGDTVGVIVADVQDKRTAYVATQTKAANAAKKAANVGLSIGELQTALTDGVLTIDQITPQLQAKGLGAADVAVLEQTMQETAAAHQAAAQLRARAAQKSTTKTLTLAQTEALTTAGHWTLAQFNAYLHTLGYVDADVASLDQIVNDKIAKAGAARGIVAATTAANPGKGLSLTQFKNAVVLGAKSIADYGTFLTAQGFSADATTTLIAEAQDALTTAQAAQTRRTAAAGTSDGRALPLADVTRAAQLGLLTSSQYVAELTARGYSSDEAALELDLLTTEIAAKKTPTPAAGTAEALVAGGAGTPAQTAGLKHVQVDGELAAKGLSLSSTEKAVKDGLLTLDAYQAWLEANGYGQADAELLRALLATSLPAPTPGATGP